MPRRPMLIDLGSPNDLKNDRIVVIPDRGNVKFASNYNVEGQRCQPLRSTNVVNSSHMPSG